MSSQPALEPRVDIARTADRSVSLLERLATRESHRLRYESYCDELDRRLEAERAQVLRAESHARTLATQLLQREAQIRSLRNELAARTQALQREQHELAQAVARAAAQAADFKARIAVLEEELRQARAGTQAASGEPRAKSSAAPALQAVLTRLDDGSAVRIALRGRTRIGRDPGSELQIDAKSVSRHHAVLIPELDSALVQDLRSTNGIRVNGSRVRCARLVSGDVLSIGTAQFRISFEPDDPDLR